MLRSEELNCMTLSTNVDFSTCKLGGNSNLGSDYCLRPLYEGFSLAMGVQENGILDRVSGLPIGESRK